MKAVLSSDLIEKLINIIKEEITLDEVIKVLYDDLIEEFYRIRNNFEGTQKKFIGSLIKQISIIFYLYNCPEGLSREELTDKTDIKRTSIYDNLMKLEGLGFILFEKIFKKEKGRPQKKWKLNREEIEKI